MKKLHSFLFFSALYLTFLCIAYGGYCTFRSFVFYNQLKKPIRGLSGQVYRSDTLLGFTPVPGARGAHVLPPQPDIPIYYDTEGFRVPEGYAKPDGESRARPLVLALGCSYTYGDACSAEDSFAWLVSEKIGGSVINAGVCGYSLAHMVLLARRLIPFFRPDYVLIQYSPWLIDRAQSYFAPSFYGRVANPFFFSSSETEVSIHPPVFMPVVFNLPIDRYKKSPRNFSDAVSFLISVGLPLHVYEDFKMLEYHLKRYIGFLPPPARNKSSIIKSAYSEIIQLAHSYGSKSLIIVLGDGIKPVPIPNELLSIKVTVVDAYAALMNRLPEQTTEYYAHDYVHWDNSNPPMVIDAHPNPFAHKLIAEAIIQNIRCSPANRIRSAE